VLLSRSTTSDMGWSPHSIGRTNCRRWQTLANEDRFVGLGLSSTSSCITARKAKPRHRQVNDPGTGKRRFWPSSVPLSQKEVHLAGELVPCCSTQTRRRRHRPPYPRSLGSGPHPVRRSEALQRRPLGAVATSLGGSCGGHALRRWMACSATTATNWVRAYSQLFQERSFGSGVPEGCLPTIDWP